MKETNQLRNLMESMIRIEENNANYKVTPFQDGAEVATNDGEISIDEDGMDELKQNPAGAIGVSLHIPGTESLYDDWDEYSVQHGYGGQEYSDELAGKIQMKMAAIIANMGVGDLAEVDAWDMGVSAQYTPTPEIAQELLAIANKTTEMSEPTDADIESDIDNDDMWNAGDGDLSVDDYRAMSDKEDIPARVKARRARGHFPK